jgi:O-acetyl-ADP-ribose deacetylase
LFCLCHGFFKFQAFPCIATGIYGFPNKEAAMIAISSARMFLMDNKDKVDRIIFCLFTPDDKKWYRKLMQVYFPLQSE